MAISASSLPATIQPMAEGTASLSPLPKDVVGVVFSQLDPQSIGQASQVCKLLNAVSKDPSLWKRQFTQFLPGIKLTCHLSAEKQFKEVYKERVAKPKAKVRSNMQLYSDMIEYLRGCTKSYGSMDSVQQWYEKWKSDLSVTPAESSNARKIQQAEELFYEFKKMCDDLSELAGPQYDGTAQSIGPNSKLAIASRELEIPNEERLKCTTQAHFDFIIASAFAYEINSSLINK